MVGGQTKEVMIMWQLLGLSLLQSMMLALGQLCLKGGFGAHATLFVDAMFCGILVVQLVVPVLWNNVWRGFASMDVYSEALAVEHGIPDGEHELCDSNGHGRGIFG